MMKQSRRRELDYSSYKHSTYTKRIANKNKHTYSHTLCIYTLSPLTILLVVSAVDTASAVFSMSTAALLA
jgi:hypothetical protein